MNYEIWDMIAYGHNEPFQPIFLHSRHDTYEQAYTSFVKRMSEDKVPCAIVTSDSEERTEKTMWIYESDDNGITVYRRRFGDYSNRELVQ